jgi:nitrite reductase/ring-hydroxylating ferredoxin subunit
MDSSTKQDNFQGKPFSGYFATAVPGEDTELTHSGPGTVLGEYMRRFWQPVCMSEQLGEVPHAIRILGEDLVAFRDGEGEVAVLHRHCCHRGASLEYGIIQPRGIRCCYHGIHFNRDGTIIEIPGEPDRGAQRARRLSQGAYPTQERDGLVFAYMGPPDECPLFPAYDAFEKIGDTRLVPFSNVFPCNWLQVMDNIADQMHTYMLHNVAALYAGDLPAGVDASAVSLSASFVKLPVMDYVPVRDDTGMVFIAGRRVNDTRVWIRINDLIVPNITQHAYLYENGDERRLWHRVNMSRWYVPVDDTNSIIYGWRMFGDTTDPLRAGDESKVGWDKIDFLAGQVGDRSYQQAQRVPGDWEAITSQRPIAVHALENPLRSDSGVFMNRKLLRSAIRGRNEHAAPAAMHARANAGLPSYCYTNNTIMDVPIRSNSEDDEAMIAKLGHDVLEAITSADELLGRARDELIVARLSTLEQSLQR